MKSLTIPRSSVKLSSLTISSKRSRWYLIASLENSSTFMSRTSSGLQGLCSWLQAPLFQSEAVQYISQWFRPWSCPWQKVPSFFQSGCQSQLSFQGIFLVLSVLFLDGLNELFIEFFGDDFLRVHHSSIENSLRGHNTCFYCLGVSQSKVRDEKNIMKWLTVIPLPGQKHWLNWMRNFLSVFHWKKPFIVVV